MELILLKSSACLLAFIAFYKVFLERTSNHQFKRYYLLAVVLISIAIPFITFIEYVEPTFVLGDFGASIYNPHEVFQPQEEPINYVPIVLWSLYGLGVLLFSARFAYNLIQIFLKIKRNPKFKTSNFISVLLQDLVVPHTFFSYIFLNKTKFENKEIPSEVLLHEETHAKQKHSLDILFIELLQILFWFNPLVYILKKDIKLNHEFLADQAVIIQGIELSNYQQLLLEFSSNSSTNHLANAINYSLIKKRFTVMKTKTSKQSLWLRSLLLLPLLGMLIYGFSSTKLVEKEVVAKILDEEIANSSNYSPTNHTARSISIKVFNNGNYEIDGVKATKNTFVSVINQLHQGITPEVRNKIMNIHLNSPKDISNEEVWFIYNSVIDYGFHRIVTNNQEIIREKGNKPFAIIDSYSKGYSEAKLIGNQKTATPEQVAEYNKLAKHYNTQIKGKGQTIIKLKDLKRITELYDLMSEAQKKNAEPFPNFPPPPPPPPPAPKIVKGELSNMPPPPPPPAPENASTEQKVKYKKMHEEYNKKYEVKHGEVSKRLPPPPPPVPTNATPEQKKKYEAARAEYHKNVAEKELVMKKRALAMKERELILEKSKNDLPPPPPPQSPLDHVISMAKKGATFYFDGKKISSDDAIKLLKENNKINISSKDSNGNNPTVHLSTKPIKINNREIPKPTAENIRSHIKEMNRHGATFYLGNDKITFEDALKYVRKNRDADVTSSTASNVVIIRKS